VESKRFHEEAKEEEKLRVKIGSLITTGRKEINCLL
jgi:hypothetical protein